MTPDPAGDVDPWGPSLDVPEFDSVPESDGEVEPIDSGVPPEDAVLGGRPAGGRRRSWVQLVRSHPLSRAALAVLPLAAILTLVAVADDWRAALLAALVAAAVAGTRLRFSDRAALGLLTVIALLAIAGWGPGVGRRPPAAPAHHSHSHSHSHSHTRRTRT